MRIGLSTASIQPGRVRDGIGVYTAGLVGALPSAGVQVQGFVLGKKSALAENTVGTADRYLVHLARDLVHRPHPLALDVDVVHFTDHFVVPCREPSVATLHDAVPLKHPEWVSPRLRSLKNHAMTRMVRHADRIVAISHYAVAELVEYFGVSEDRIDVVPNGIDAQWLQTLQEPHSPLIIEGLGTIADYFLFVGTLQPRKNLDRILDAYEMLPAAVRHAHPLVVVGRPGWRCEATVQRLQALDNHGATVHWLRNVRSRNELRHIYQGAFALVFASLHEGFGLPVLEAFASNVPVITSTQTSLPEVAGDAALTVDPYDAEAISHAMMTLCEKPMLRRELITRGSDRVAQFTWEETARKLAAIYASVR